MSQDKSAIAEKPPEKAGAQAAPEEKSAEKTAAPPKKKRCWGPFLRWTVDILIVILVLGGVLFLIWVLGLERMLSSNWPFLHPFWLPLLFLMLYVLFWLSWGLLQLFRPDRVGQDFPDINRAWEEARLTLARSGIDLREVPVFLVVGQPEEGVDALMGAPELPLKLITPRSPEAPLRVYAQEDAVFVTCPEASVLGQNVQFLVEQNWEEEKKRAMEKESASAPVPPSPPPVNTKEPEKKSPASPQLGVTAAPPETSPPPEKEPTEPAVVPDVPEDEEEEKRVLELLADVRSGRSRSQRPTFLKKTEEVHQQTTRLQYLCRLLVRDRQPYCPINGVLILVPYWTLEDDMMASDTGAACRYDLTVVQRVLQVKCPAFLLLCDMDKSPRFLQMVERIPYRQRISQLGQNFPLYPDVNDMEIPRLVESGLVWFTDSLLPSVIQNLFRIESSAESPKKGFSLAESLHSNIPLYRFLVEFRERKNRLARLLIRGVLLDLPGIYYFGGVYLGATSRKYAAFSRGVLQKLIDNQNAVTWNDEKLARDRSFCRWASLLVLINALLLIGGPILAYLFWPW